MNHDIFLSYASADTKRAEHIAHTLEQKGLSVWWDRNIPPGKTWDQFLGEALLKARCVVVLWTKNSIASNWVKDEATRGSQRGVLIPALLEDVEIPLGFGRIEAADLRDWGNDTSHPEFVNFLSAIQTLVGAERPVTTGITEPRQQTTMPPQSTPVAPKRAVMRVGVVALLAVVSLVAYILYTRLDGASGSLNVEVWRVEGDRKAQLLASHSLGKPDQLGEVRDWLIERLSSVARPEPGPILVELQVPQDLAAADVQVKTTPSTELETYIYVVSERGKARVRSPLTRERLALLEGDFFIEFRHTGYQSEAVEVVLGSQMEKTFTLIPKKISVAVERFEGTENRIGQKLSQLLVQDDRLKITTPDALENLREEIRKTRAEIGVNRMAQTAIRDSLGVDFIVAGALEN